MQKGDLSWSRPTHRTSASPSSAIIQRMWVQQTGSSAETSNFRFVCLPSSFFIFHSFCYYKCTGGYRVKKAFQCWGSRCFFNALLIHLHKQTTARQPQACRAWHCSLSCSPGQWRGQCKCPQAPQNWVYLGRKKMVGKENFQECC